MCKWLLNPAWPAHALGSRRSLAASAFAPLQPPPWVGRDRQGTNQASHAANRTPCPTRFLLGHRCFTPPRSSDALAISAPSANRPPTKYTHTHTHMYLFPCLHIAPCLLTHCPRHASSKVEYHKPSTTLTALLPGPSRMPLSSAPTYSCFACCFSTSLLVLLVSLFITQPFPGPLGCTAVGCCRRLHCTT